MDNEGYLERAVLVYLLQYLMSPAGLASSTQVVLVNGTLGGSATFDVVDPLPEFHRIMWNFGETGNVTVVTEVSNDNVDPDYNLQYRGRSQLYENGTLKLDNLTYADEGRYNLYIYNNFTTTIIPYELAVLAILRAPSFSVLSDLIVDGKNVTLYCDSGSQNVTTYTFYRGEKTICSEPHVTCRGAYLDLTPITESDSGSYTCSIQNPVSSSTSAPLSLTVSVPVSAVTLTTNTSDQLLWPGEDSVHLLCSSNGTNVTYSWSLDGEPIPEEPRYRLTPETSLLIISPISEKDNGEFMCMARNGINKENSSRLNLKLAAAVSAVSLTSNTSGALWAGQDSVSLYCTAQGSDITFSWRMNGLLVSSNPPYYITGGESPPTSTLTISPISRSHSGPFTCTATNWLNNETSNEINLEINWSPEGGVACLATPSDDEHIMLGCSWSGGRPSTNVTMRFNHTMTTSSNEVTRNVTRHKIIQGSNLTCLGEQDGRTSWCTVILDPPHCPGHNNSAVIDIAEGETVAMTVSLVSGLPADFTWFYHNPDPVPVQDHKKFMVESNSSRSSLLVSGAMVSESGIYECRAKNIIGSETFNFNLRVTSQASRGLSDGAIAGIVIGVLAALILLAVILCLLIKRAGAGSAVTLFYGAIGEAAFLSGGTAVTPNQKIDWSLDTAGRLIASRLPSGIVSYSGRCDGGQCTLYPNGTLRMDQLTPADNRTYTVTLREGGRNITELVQLNVYYRLTAPSLNVSSIIRPVEGNNLTLLCDAGPQTVLSFYFYRNNQILFCGEDHVTCDLSSPLLYFDPILGSDNGSYTCGISNPVSRAVSPSIVLDVAVPVSGVTLRGNTTAPVIANKEAIALVCSSSGTDISYDWRLKGSPLPKDPRYLLTGGNSTLLISPVSRNDGGDFMCTVSNYLNSERSNTLSLT
ncbi:hemicentin-1-like, partial [Leptodactylus fuscus]|uniref:hemicentin-1-like n=1 Tax=Leptodactylus fuscus TaxID=238119 RepID=UPI003F4E93B2